MSLFNKESQNNLPSLGQPQNPPLDSGLGSSINPLSGSFGEGYQLLSGSYESECYDYYDQDGGPLSLQPASLPLLTTVIDTPPQQVPGDIQNEDSSSSIIAHSTITETGSSSTVAYTASATDTAHTDVKDDSDTCSCTSTTNVSTVDAECSNNSGRYPNPIHDGTVSDIQRSESGAEQDANDPPSPVLSHVRAEPLKVKEIIIRGSVDENHPGIISERVLVESGRAHSPP